MSLEIYQAVVRLVFSSDATFAMLGATDLQRGSGLKT
jgi:hypothetical protein